MRYRALIVALLALCLGVITACSEGPTSGGKDLLTYDEIRGTGLANKCPQLAETSRGSIPVDASQSYFIKELCLEPTTFFVKEEPTNKRQKPEFIAGKLVKKTFKRSKNGIFENGKRLIIVNLKIVY